MELTVNPPTPVVEVKPYIVQFRIIYLNADFEHYINFSEKFAESLQVEYFGTKEGVLEALQENYPADVIVAHAGSGGLELLDIIRSSSGFGNIPFVLMVDRLSQEAIDTARAKHADDVFSVRFDEGDLLTRIKYFKKRQWYVANKASKIIGSQGNRTPFWKRAIDVLTTGTAVLLLLPVFLLIALLIRLDSKGPVFYRSKRVGSGYKIFDLYKFRTMRTDADQLIRKMAALSMYNKSTEPVQQIENNGLCEECQAGGKCKSLLFHDGKEICEKLYHFQKEQKAAFMKFQNDPRITRFGQFLRNSSLDELPQLINILKGDMSLVGNRPLPLYEAEKMTTDDKIFRFAGPAGLTGLWQVTKRGKGKADMSEEERTQLDITYAKEFSFKMDMQIILKTFPALLQSENV
ncbi:sugar transferase [Dyadobacter arcticus]|uniref:Lipopolysaccharide/colanic/teichoic acid biosynthesis glycosyltransferase n=1 Tax=Dyadobacter arcticus TaxID=1078754 RepID=A0ABX0UPP2_9BACT|nr:sugar transferase [Dyadobacter arcticus]NIJ53640.1 lipopolysaccharide/colanic/teichoic acid biosynthesis glycosyltransferase [Dyadobacter arcticus]